MIGLLYVEAEFICAFVIAEIYWNSIAGA